MPKQMNPSELTRWIKDNADDYSETITESTKLAIRNLTLNWTREGWLDFIERLHWGTNWFPRGSDVYTFYYGLIQYAHGLCDGRFD